MSINSLLIASGALSAYTKGLSTISDNIANMNSTAYKGKRLSFYEMPAGSNSDAGNEGSSFGGVNSDTVSRLYEQGNIQKTAADFDYAIQGNGYFMLKGKQGIEYTRAGSFSFDDKNILTHRGSNLPLLAYNNAGELNQIELSSEKQIYPGIASSKFIFSKVLNSGSSAFDISEPVSIYNSNGNATQVKIGFIKDTKFPTQWKVTIKSADSAATEYGSGSISFLSSGDIDPAHSTISLEFSPDKIAKQSLTLDFSKAKNFSTLNSTLSLETQDGLIAGQLTRITTSESGELTANYSNGKTSSLAKIALAQTSTPDLLTARDFGVFTAENKTIQFKTNQAGKNNLGTLQQGALEASNVDLTQQFSSLIITQRGYQAASQVITATNEMLGLLFDIRGKR